MKNIHELMQRRIAETCIGASSLRNQGAPGVNKAARGFLAKFPLGRFAVSSMDSFLAVLDETTEELKNNLPKDAQNWCAARKAINLFLRDVLYNCYLSEHYKLVSIEPFLEIPLDSYVVKELFALNRTVLPRWRGIKFLHADDSRLYQNEALRYSQELGTRRIHLDLIWWRRQSEEAANPNNPTNPSAEKRAL